ncbi:MAG TPA: corrinoid protein [Methanomassiliicoccales archaeon]|nr:corrinoid protein [Methanomassiliicoccales archaeon]HPR98444.1 corrinoid protein [Methanomassiliicoccales archaeon]
MTNMDLLIDIVVKGRIKEAKGETQKLLDAGVSAKEIIFNGLSKAMEIVGEKYEKKEYFLPQVLLSAQTLYQGLNLALPKLDTASADAAGRIVLCVVEGDVHDIGKNIVKALLTGAGNTMFDLGRDVPLKDIVQKAKDEHAQIIATSTLMTPTLAGMKEIEKMLAEGGMKGKVKTMVGGGATSADFAKSIGADGWGYDANEAVREAIRLLKN